MEFVANGIQGKQSRFELNRIDENTLEVVDKQTSEVVTAIPTKRAKQWKIRLRGKNGKTAWRYFTEEHIQKSAVRRKVESIPQKKRMKRNNVETTIFQY